MPLRKIVSLLPFLLFWMASAVCAEPLRGSVSDRTTHQPLIGAAIVVEGTTRGTTTDAEGRFTLSLPEGTHALRISYLSYVTCRIEVRIPGDGAPLHVELEPESQELSAVAVTVRKNLASERVLQRERIASNVAIENLGAQEMALKGIADVQQGVRKLPGVSIASAGQLIVRGLGDRYSITTLNGQPIASPNPDNKLIPLDIFPASAVRNITVSKVYEASSYADYSGARIDIDTRENTGERLFTAGLHVGGRFNTLGRSFYSMDHRSLFTQPGVDPAALTGSAADFRRYAAAHDIFDTDFSVSKRTALPAFGGNLAWSRSFRLGRQTLSVLASGGMSNDLQRMDDAGYRLLEATGTVTDEYTYDSYTRELKIAALASLGITLRGADRIGYTLFYARNAEDEYMRREGRDQEDHRLAGSLDVLHVYTLLTHQLAGTHLFGPHWTVRWSASHTGTTSDEPDRRQVMFLRRDDGRFELFKLNRQETMRYFGAFDEREWNARLAADRTFGRGHRLTAGVAYKDKSRDYDATRFYYDLTNLSPVVDDIYATDAYLGFDRLADGSLSIDRQRQPKDRYAAGHTVAAGYLSLDLRPADGVLVGLGVRYERSRQWVEYANDQGLPARRDLKGDDLFPALNVRWELGGGHQLRLAASRTVTRPSFVEMAPFLYQESYGAVQIRGNEELRNSYNYNLDLRYERLDSHGDLISATLYGKYLDRPIERVQMLSGGAAVHTFRNADRGVAAGAEIELRKALGESLRLGVNASYMYTDVKLPEGGVYTHRERALQGASPYLLNADATWSPRLGGERRLHLTLLYNLQGPRIHTVGIAGLGDVKQLPEHTLDFTAVCSLGRRAELKVRLGDLLNRTTRFEQEVPQRGGRIEVERYRRGTSFEAGIDLKF